MFEQTINGILEIIAREEPVVRKLPKNVITARFNNQNRSIKMLVGHLIDSASNNHQRMVRLQYAPLCGHSMPNTLMGMLVFPDLRRTMTYGYIFRIISTRTGIS